MSVAHTRSTELGAFATFEPKLTEEDKLRQVLFMANIDPVIQHRNPICPAVSPYQS
jgi:hypothetical protein